MALKWDRIRMRFNDLKRGQRFPPQFKNRRPATNSAYGIAKLSADIPPTGDSIMKRRLLKVTTPLQPEWSGDPVR